MEPPIVFATQRSPTPSRISKSVSAEILDSDVAPLGMPISRPSLTKSE